MYTTAPPTIDRTANMKTAHFSLSISPFLIIGPPQLAVRCVVDTLRTSKTNDHPAKHTPCSADARFAPIRSFAHRRMGFMNILFRNKEDRCHCRTLRVRNVVVRTKCQFVLSPSGIPKRAFPNRWSRRIVERRVCGRRLPHRDYLETFDVQAEAATGFRRGPARSVSP